jgi:hypothetical protein
VTNTGWLVIAATLLIVGLEYLPALAPGPPRTQRGKRAVKVAGVAVKETLVARRVGAERVTLDAWLSPNWF